ncbi:MAG: hypothetical protein ACFB13_21245 [Kiloniellaceae bacterium]
MSGAASMASPDHLAGFTVEPVPGEPGQFSNGPAGAAGGDTGAGGAEDALGLGLRTSGPDMGAGFISREVFYDGFRVAFNVGANVPPYLGSLAIGKGEEDAARQAAGVLYDICLETPALHFLVKPGGVWFQRVAAIGAFAVPKGMAVAAELGARKAAKRDSQVKASAEPRRAAAGGAAEGGERPSGVPASAAPGAYDFAPRDAA